MLCRKRVLLSVLCVLAAIPGALGDLSARVLSGPEADSNARREILGEIPHADALWRNQLSLSLSPRFANHRVLLETQAGHKAFLRESSQDLLVGELHTRVDSRWTDWLGTFVDVAARDRRQRNLARSYSAVSSDAGVVLGPWGRFSVVMGAGPRGFAFWPDFYRGFDPGARLARFSYGGAGGYAAGVMRLSDLEAITGTLGVDGRAFAGRASVKILPDGTREFSDTLNRADASAFGDLSVESVRALYFRASWRLTGNLSNSRGETYARNRFSVTAGVVLPGSVRVLVDGQLQLTRWPEGLGLGERLALQEGDENQTSVGAQLSVPLVRGVWMEAKTNAYTAEFSSARVPFLRVTAFAGLGYRI